MKADILILGIVLAVGLGLVRALARRAGRRMSDSQRRTGLGIYLLVIGGVFLLLTLLLLGSGGSGSALIALLTGGFSLLLLILGALRLARST